MLPQECLQKEADQEAEKKERLDKKAAEKNAAELEREKAIQRARDKAAAAKCVAGRDRDRPRSRTPPPSGRPRLELRGLRSLRPRPPSTSPPTTRTPVSSPMPMPRAPKSWPVGRGPVMAASAKSKALASRAGFTESSSATTARAQSVRLLEDKIRDEIRRNEDKVADHLRKASVYEERAADSRRDAVMLLERNEQLRKLL